MVHVHVRWHIHMSIMLKHSCFPFSHALLLQGATLLVTLSCHLSGCPWQDPLPPPNMIPRQLGQLSNFRFSEKKGDAFFTQIVFFTSKNWGCSKTRHNAPSILVLGKQEHSNKRQVLRVSLFKEHTTGRQLGLPFQFQLHNKFERSSNSLG